MKELMTASGRYASHKTMIRSDATLAAKALSVFLDSPVLTVKCSEISGDHDWHVFKLPIKMHERARTFLAGWEAGRAHGIDVAYGRTAKDTDDGSAEFGATTERSEEQD